MSRWTERWRTAFERWQSLRYVVVGAVNTAFSYGVYGLAIVAGLPLPAASLLALLLGVALGFVVQGRIVFGALSTAVLIRFVAAWSALYALFVSVVIALGALGLEPLFAGAIATGLNVAVSYFVMRDLVFRSPVVAGE